MKVSVIRKDDKTVIGKLEKVLKTEAVMVMPGSVHGIVDLARETYRHNNRTNVVYDGCALECLNNSLEESLFDVYEQIALASMVNLDRVFVVKGDFDSETLSFYAEYGEMLPGKIVFVSDESEIVL